MLEKHETFVHPLGFSRVSKVIVYSNVTSVKVKLIYLNALAVLHTFSYFWYETYMFVLNNKEQ